MREIGALVQGDGWYKEVCLYLLVEDPNCQMGLKKMGRQHFTDIC